ncbi:hypothetical protein EOB59_34025, partial [Mesorhizobium sp. M7A.F.Ca.MR.176.00.0.0]
MELNTGQSAHRGSLRSKYVDAAGRRLAAGWISIALTTGRIAAQTMCAAVKGLALVDVLEVGHGTLLRGIGSPKPFVGHASRPGVGIAGKGNRTSKTKTEMTNNEIPPVGPAVNNDDEALASPFVKCLLRLIR